MVKTKSAAKKPPASGPVTPAPISRRPKNIAFIGYIDKKKVLKLLAELPEEEAQTFTAVICRMDSKDKTVPSEKILLTKFGDAYKYQIVLYVHA